MGENVIPLRTSRRFLIQQAVINAVHRNYPFGVRRFGMAGALKVLMRGKLFTMDEFQDEVRIEYRLLRMVYEEATPIAAFDLPPGFWCGACE